MKSDLLTSQITKMILSHPTLYKSRSDCLNQLFCTIGNGYEWQHGTLLSSNEQSNIKGHFRNETKELTEKLGQLSVDTTEEYELSVAAMIQINVREHNAMVEFRRNNAPLLALVTKPLASIYPVCEHSNLAKVPDDVKPSYLNGVIEAITLIFSTPAWISIHPHSDCPPYTAQVRQQNLEWADRILADLQQRFPSTRNFAKSFQDWSDTQAKLTEEILQEFGKGLQK